MSAPRCPHCHHSHRSSLVCPSEPTADFLHVIGTRGPMDISEVCFPRGFRFNSQSPHKAIPACEWWRKLPREGPAGALFGTGHCNPCREQLFTGGKQRRPCVLCSSLSADRGPYRMQPWGHLSSCTPSTPSQRPGASPFPSPLESLRPRAAPELSPRNESLGPA